MDNAGAGLVIAAMIVGALMMLWEDGDPAAGIAALALSALLVVLLV